MKTSQTISHCPNIIPYVDRKSREAFDRRPGTPEKMRAAHEARISRYASDVVECEKRIGQSFINGRFHRQRPEVCTNEPKPILAMSIDGTPIATFESVRQFARFAIAHCRTKSNPAAASSTIHSAMRRGKNVFGMRLTPIAP